MTQSDDQGLTTLLHQAVDDVEPADRLGQIRVGVRRQRSRRLWMVSGGGAAIAAAATVAAVALVASPKTSADPQPGQATQQTSGPTTDDPSPPHPSGRAAVATYYLGGRTDEPKLYREFHQANAGATASVDGLTSPPDDPDYRTLWPSGAFASAEITDYIITVEIADPALRDRPASMSQAEAEASIQQVIYTLQAAAGRRLAVQFTYQDNPIDQVLGVPTSEPLANAPVLQTLSRVNLTTPAEGQEVTGTLEVEGVSNSNEANVPWTLEDADGTTVEQGAITAEGWMGEKLFPFRDSIDVSSLDPGTYTLIVSTDDPSGAGNVDQDSRTVIIR